MQNSFFGFCYLNLSNFPFLLVCVDLIFHSCLCQGNIRSMNTGELLFLHGSLGISDHRLLA